MLSGFFKVSSGKKYGNKIADYLGVDQRLFHSAMEEGGCEMHLLKLHDLKQENIELSEISYHSTKYLLPGFLSIEKRFGKQRLITYAVQNVGEFISKYEQTLDEHNHSNDKPKVNPEYPEGRYELSCDVILAQRLRGRELEKEPYVMRSDDLEGLKSIALVKSLGGVEVTLKDLQTGELIAPN